MAIAVVSHVNVICEHCGEMVDVNAADYIANLDEVVPSFLVGLSYEFTCDNCQTMNTFALPVKDDPLLKITQYIVPSSS